MLQDSKVWLDKLRQLSENGETVWRELKDNSVIVFLTLCQHYAEHRKKPNVVEPPELQEQLTRFEKSWQKAVKLVPTLRTTLPEALRLKAIELGEHFLLTRSR